MGHEASLRELYALAGEGNDQRASLKLEMPDQANLITRPVTRCLRCKRRARLISVMNSRGWKLQSCGTWWSAR